MIFRIGIWLLILLAPCQARLLHGTASGITPSGGVNIGDERMFPFVNLMKMAFSSTNEVGTTFIYPNNLTADQYPTGTLGGQLGYGIAVPQSYYGKYVLSVTGTVSSSGMALGNGFQGQAYATTGSPTLSCGAPPCVATNNLNMSGTNFTVTFDNALPITNVTDNGSGKIRITVSSVNMVAGQHYAVQGVVGSDGNGCGANSADWTIDTATSTHIDLLNSSFPGGCTYTSGGGVFQNPTQGFYYNIVLSFASGATFTGLTNIKVCKLADYNADNTCSTTAGKTAWPSGLNDDFVQKLAVLRPKFIRYLDYYNNVFGPTAPGYSEGPQTSWLAYYTVSWLPSKWFGTATGTNAYSASCTGACTYTLTGGAPADGDYIQMYIPNTNTTQATTLTITDKNSITSSALPIYGNYGVLLQMIMTGTVTTGDKATLTFTSSCISGGSTTAEYTALPGDTLNSFSIGIYNAIFAKAALTNMPLAMVATNSFGQGTLGISYAINACSVTASAAMSGPGVITETIDIGYNTTGAWNGPASGILTNTLYSLVYSSLLHGWITQAGASTGRNLPFSTLIDITNAVSTVTGTSVGCWLQTPMIWSDASFTALANYAAANCTGPTYFELGNEIWGTNPVTPVSGHLGQSVGLGIFPYLAYQTLRQIQLTTIARTSFSGKLSKMHMVGASQLSGLDAATLQGTGLCGTIGTGSCGNTAYQNVIGINYNVSGNQPGNYYTDLSQAPYYAGAILNAGDYSGDYGTWSATSSSVSGNILTVAGTVTGDAIYPNQGISSCVGTYIKPPNADDPTSGQLTGKITTTLTAPYAANTVTGIALTSVAGITAGMWVYNASLGRLNFHVQSVNPGAKTIDVIYSTFNPSPNWPGSLGSNDTMVFGGLAGTYQLNNTSCAAGSGTITGGDVLGMTHAADNYNGTNGAIGSQADALDWVYQDALNMAQKGTMTFSVAAMSQYYRTISGAAAPFGLAVQDYEGGFQALTPNTMHPKQGNQCALLGISNSYCDVGTVGVITIGRIGALLTAFKNDSRFKTLEGVRHTKELALLPANSTTMWYVFSSNGRWGLFSDDLYSPPPWKSYDAICHYNGGAC